MEVVILAAGKGTRMLSKKSKVLHTIAGIPLLEHVLNSALSLGANKIHIVVGYGSDEIYNYFEKKLPDHEILWALQKNRLGTAHAVQQACPAIDAEASTNQVLILYGDVPLIQPDTLKNLLSRAKDNNISLLTLTTTENKGLGRIIRNKSGQVTAIIEEKDADEGQKKITEVNSGIMVLPAARLESWLGRIENTNKQLEYYLTDLIKIAVADGYEVTAVNTQDKLEVKGVNLREPARVDVRGDLTCGQDVEIDVNTVFEGVVKLADNVIIGTNVSIKDSTIGEGSKILSGTIIEGADVGSKANIGPHARIRPGTVINNNVKVGNFVEIKKSVLGEGSKANHLAYIGDAEIGDNCNIGAGTIFCNYDGANKHTTVLGNDVFIGSNSVLVAPVQLSDNAFVAAGSAINANVPKNNLAVGRGKQRNISGWKRPIKKASE